MCSCEVGCLAKCPIPTQAARLGGAGPWRFGWHIPPQTPGSDCGARRRSPDDACGGAKKARGTVSAGRRAPQVDTHSLTHVIICLCASINTRFESIVTMNIYSSNVYVCV